MNPITIVRKIIFLTSVAFSILIISSSCWAATYYVDNVNGNDTNSGISTSLAWKNISKVNASKFLPGDQILFARGQTWREQLSPSSAGASGNLITFGAYGSGNAPIISGSNVVSGWSLYSGTVFRATFSTSVTWPNVYTNHSSYPSLIKGTYSSLSAGQFDINGGYLYVNIGTNPSTYIIESIVRTNAIANIRSYIKIDGLHLTHAQCGIQQWNYQADGVVVTNSTIDWISNQGIYTGNSSSINTTYWQVNNNIFDHIGCYPPPTGTAGRHGIYVKFGSNWIIEQNSFAYCGYGVTNGGFGINLNGSSNNMVGYNSFKNCMSGAIQLFEDTAGGSSNNQIYYNVSNGDKRFVYVTGGPDHTGNVIYNNTAYGFTYAGIDIEASNTKAITVKNNILWSSAPNVKIYKVDSGSAFVGADYNDVGPAASGFISYNGNSYSTLAAFRQANTSFDAHSISADPIFINPGNYKLALSTNSPCRNKGINLSLTRDIEGNSVSSKPNPDIGSYQFVETSLGSPTNLRIL